MYASNTAWDADFRDHYKHCAYSELSGSKDNHVYDDKEIMVPDLSHLTDEEFLERLAKLRREHQQTLDYCDRLGLHAKDHPRSDLTSQSCPVASVDENYTLTTDCYSSLAGDLITTSFDDALRPPFRARRAPPRKHVSVGSTQRKFTRKDREKQLRDQLERDRQEMREYALDKYLTSLSDEDRSVEENDDTKRAKTKHRLVRSNSLSKLVDDGWRYRVTVPKPFKMMIRESQKVPTKSKSAANFELQRSRNQMEEELECSMKFKASPAPATIYVPLYEEMAVEKEFRRRQKMALRQKELAAMQRPFAFVRREEDRLAKKGAHQRESAEDDARVPDANFKARPFPHHLFSSAAYDWMSEQEEIKEWQRRARADKLLKSSSLPKNMMKKPPSHVCTVTKEEDGCTSSKSGAVRRRSPRRMYDGAEVCGHVDLFPQRPLSPAVCCCHDDKPRWPRTCVNANQLTRSLSDVHLSSQAADVRARSPASDRLRSAPKSILKSTSRRVGDVGMKDQQRTQMRATWFQQRSAKPSRGHSTKNTHDYDRIRREIEHDLNHID